MSVQHARERSWAGFFPLGQHGLVHSWECVNMDCRHDSCQSLRPPPPKMSCWNLVLLSLVTNMNCLSSKSIWQHCLGQVQGNNQLLIYKLFLFEINWWVIYVFLWQGCREIKYTYHLILFGWIFCIYDWRRDLLYLHMRSLIDFSEAGYSAVIYS